MRCLKGSETSKVLLENYFYHFQHPQTAEHILYIAFNIAKNVGDQLQRYYPPSAVILRSLNTQLTNNNMHLKPENCKWLYFLVKLKELFLQ